MFERMRSDLTEQLQQIRDAGLWKPERVIDSPQGANVAVSRARAGREEQDGEVLKL